MGSLKDETKGLRDDCQPCEKTDNGEHPGSPDSISAPEEPQINTSQESTTQGDNQPKLQMNTSYVEESAGDPVSKDSALLAGVCDNTDNPNSMTEKVCTQTNISPLKQQHEADQTSAMNSSAIKNDATMATQSVPNEPQTDLSPHGSVEIHSEKSVDRNVDQDTEKDAGCENITVPVPCTSGPSTPAPFGQHHIRTQVSLEVVQCHSVATSPMTPPEGAQSFFFPNSLGGFGAVGAETKDAELQVERQVELCSVATSPMTPKTPYSTAFPEIVEREMVEMEEKVKKSVEQGQMQQDSSPVRKSPAETESHDVPTESALKLTTSKDPAKGLTASPEKSDRPDLGTADSQVDRNQQCKQQRMGSMDQDITILVTHHDNFETEEEEEGETTESLMYPIKPEMVKIDEYDEEKRDDTMEKISEISNSGDNFASDKSNTNNQPITTEEPSLPASKQPKTEDRAKSKVKDSEQVCQSEDSLKKSNIPESPAPFGCHNIRTQVSLEVVQCHSAATSPMTPPEGDQAFYFPSTSGRPGAVGTETKDAELQVGRQVEFRSVATAPMTPRTPIATCFPEIRKEESIDERTVKDVKKEATTERAEEEKLTEEQPAEGKNCQEKGEEKSEEPVQEVSWDEKGMTWEVYGAVVEVAVLGSAIQKHLEKQVKKKEQSVPPLSPLSPSAEPLPSDSAQGGSGKGRAGKRGERDGKVNRRRRNPFRLLLQNMQQPHCCSRAHATE